MMLDAQALLRVFLRLLGFELRPVSPFSSMTFALLVYHADSHGAVGPGLLLGLSAPDVAQRVAHPVDDVAHFVDGQVLTDGGAEKVLLGLLLQRYLLGGRPQASNWLQLGVRRVRTRDF
ncbi:hypothetical protein PG991_009103 [Apiospora marii]|uniref:Uncharacterized protein n=1 Tax=Apiospora marii TaxID=335849 RepID=A0ABR1RJP6_9PEZI